MVDLLEGNHLGQKETIKKQPSSLTYRVLFALFSFSLRRCKMLIFQLPCLFTVVYDYQRS